MFHRRYLLSAVESTTIANLNFKLIMPQKCIEFYLMRMNSGSGSHSMMAKQNYTTILIRQAKIDLDTPNIQN
jgi:hypothetical protein